jgi:hypothetical protein
MARIRSIHPGLFTDEAFMELSMAARVLLPGLWVEAWDDGVIEWRTKRIKARLFPCDNIDVDALLAELVSQDMIRKFEAGGMKYAAIKNFRKWQRPEKPNSSNVLPKDLEDYVQLHYRAVDKLPKQNADPAVSRQQIDNKSPTGIPPLDDNSTTGSGNVRQKGGREEGRMEEESSLRSLSPREALAASDKPTQGESDEKIHQISEVRAFAQFWEAYPAPARSAPDYARKAYRRELKRGATRSGGMTRATSRSRNAGLRAVHGGWLLLIPHRLQRRRARRETTRSRDGRRRTIWPWVNGRALRPAANG